ncbi:MAG TPA: outer membrane beta-barrel protein [Spirochaetota bacterium]|nr:outer membrane beta-barrel protein [Spirochaetota bacterium]HPS87799.1 outer membrane beta-barrel protein [Spirochaetota bacterium]
MKRIVIILVLFASNILYAEDKFSAGFSMGYQYDAGMLSDKRGIQADVQQNISAGLVLKLDMSRVFLRSGVEYSYPFSKGEITNSSAGAVQETEVIITEVPVYAGINIPLRDYGVFYMGGGGSYIFGSGRVKTSSGSEKINEQLFGYGLIAGIESEIYSDASLLFEWEYLAARSSPVASTSPPYDDYYIDYSGHRVRFGVIYHFNRY